jgi:hypothetical protein
MKDFIKSLMSVEEDRNSIIVWILVATATLLLWKSFKLGDAPENLMHLVEFLIGTVATLNAVKHAATTINNKNNGGEQK